MRSAKRFQRKIIQRIYTSSTKSSWRTFVDSCNNARPHQESKLKHLLENNAFTAYGSTYGFKNIRSLAQYQEQVPIISYSDVQPWVTRIASGEKHVLTAEEVLIFERTSGSTAANKLIPYTKSLLAEFSSAVSPWMHDLFLKHPRLFGQGSYWSISPALRSREKTECGIPIGFEDDTEYLGPAEKMAWGILNSVPSQLARETNFDEWERLTSFYLLQDEDLGFISVWSPTFAIRLMEGISRWLPELLAKLPKSRAKNIKIGLEREGRLNARALWPDLALLSTWADGPSSSFLKDLETWFPDVPLQPKGLLATEGVVSIPVTGQNGGVFAAASHFVEFIDINNETRNPLMADELVPGGMYSPILSTSGGLYRYHLKDVVQCTGRFGSAPLLRFEGKYDQISDFTGEKLNGIFVQRVLDVSRQDLELECKFVFLAPVSGSPMSYRLYIESDRPDSDLERFAQLIDARLSESHHYGHSRRMRQLGPITFRRIQKGTSKFEQQMRARGMRAGNIKPSVLGLDTKWDEVLLASEELKNAGA